jgi:hypothetical protein
MMGRLPRGANSATNVPESPRLEKRNVFEPSVGFTS